MTSFSGSFRVGARELCAMQYMRYVKHMSMNHIASVLNRSVATVYDHVAGTSWDNRENPHMSRIKGVWHFKASANTIRMQVWMFLEGIFEDISEAFKDQSVPITLLRRFLTENWLLGEEQDPG